MSETNWTLIDVERDLYVDHLELGPAELGPAAQGCSVRLRTLRGGLREGLQRAFANASRRTARGAATS
ncbi:MAG: hypothetical protein K8T25_16370 [Planctomycetia bacterium]|nr:hypothetical protein [Planctomycetia bacterium]